MSKKSRVAAGLQLVLRDDKWEIVGHIPVIGPYDSKAEGMEALRCMKQFYLQEAVKDEFDDYGPTLEDVIGDR